MQELVSLGTGFISLVLATVVGVASGLMVTAMDLHHGQVTLDSYAQYLYYLQYLHYLHYLHYLLYLHQLPRLVTVLVATAAIATLWILKDEKLKQFGRSLVIADLLCLCHAPGH